MDSFTHIDSAGDIKMVDISEKDTVFRVAKGYARIKLAPETINLIMKGDIVKGNVLTTAKIAGIMAAKTTDKIIPLCHQINLTSIDIAFTINPANIEIHTAIKCSDRTGAEMEALHSASAAALTIYDMCKAVDKQMVIEEIRLCSKSKRSV